jgi:hypothetical protein
MMLKWVILIVLRPGEVLLTIGFVLLLKRKMCFWFAQCSRREHGCSRREQCLILKEFCLGSSISARTLLFSARTSVWTEICCLGGTISARHLLVSARLSVRRFLSAFKCLVGLCFYHICIIGCREYKLSTLSRVVALCSRLR